MKPIFNFTNMASPSAPWGTDIVGSFNTSKLAQNAVRATSLQNAQHQAEMAQRAREAAQAANLKMAAMKMEQSIANKNLALEREGLKLTSKKINSDISLARAQTKALSNQYDEVGRAVSDRSSNDRLVAEIAKYLSPSALAAASRDARGQTPNPAAIGRGPAPTNPNSSAPAPKPVTSTNTSTRVTVRK